MFNDKLQDSAEKFVDVQTNWARYRMYRDIAGDAILVVLLLVTILACVWGYGVVKEFGEIMYLW